MLFSLQHLWFPVQNHWRNLRKLLPSSIWTYVIKRPLNSDSQTANPVKDGFLKKMKFTHTYIIAKILSFLIAPILLCFRFHFLFDHFKCTFFIFCACSITWHSWGSTATVYYVCRLLWRFFTLLIARMEMVQV